MVRVVRSAEDHALAAAVGTAMRSPCAKSKRGVVIFKGTYVLAAGYNHPPSPMRCDASPECYEACGKICVHAEVAALRCLSSCAENLEMLHVKVIDGVAVPSGPPSCWQCSREILDSGQFSRVWLLHERGLVAYTPLEFHEATLRHHGLPVARDGRAL